ncbi:MAG: 5'/3'-nucleotidase SurE [Bacteroidales bacterium]|nr:5'/3'-nucleotidase SurE [Bacteroidales bacterium]
MRILVTNDDGYQASGLQSLVRTLKPFGDLTIIAPKSPQSGMSMAVSMGFRPIAVKHIETLPGEDWWYLDGTPASCVKFGIDNILYPVKPDLVVSGINHGNNAATATLYSGTIGAAMEGTVNGIPSIGVSLDTFAEDADFSAIEQLFPDILRRLLANYNPRKGSFYNVNFPNLPAGRIKGIRPARVGYAHWEKEYVSYGAEFLASRGLGQSFAARAYADAKLPEEELYVMAGDFVSEPDNLPDADHLLMEQGYVTVTPQNIYNTDLQELERLCDII